MKKFSIGFHLRIYKKYPDKATVFIRIVHGRTKSELGTGIKCRIADWDPIRERFHTSTFLNPKLAELESKIYAAKQSLDQLENEYTAADVKFMVTGQSSKKQPLLLEYYHNYMHKKTELGEVSRATLQKYWQTFRYLEKFLIHSENESLKVADIKFNFISEFEDFLKRYPIDDYGRKMKEISVNKHHSRIKAVLNDALQRGAMKQNPYKGYKLRYPTANREYLTKDEIVTLHELDLQHNDYLDKVRDIFLFSCYTALRFRDAMALTMECIHKIGDSYFLRIDQIKTGERREIPLLDPAINIIEKYIDSAERKIENKVLPQLSNVRVNAVLKYIAQFAGINKHLTHHVARHTCATTVLLDNGVPITTVSHWLGHNSVRTTQIYAQISHSNLEKEMRRLNDII